MGFLSPRFPVFLPALLVLYYRVSPRHQWKLLLIGSLLFYSGAGPLGLCALGLTFLSAWLGGMALEKNKRRGLLWLLTGLQGTLLLSVKWAVHFEDLLLPLGISYYSLQAIGYLADVYRGAPAEHHAGRLGLFLAYFPQLVQGPISRHEALASQLYGHHPYDGAAIAEGMKRILWGYFKKLVIADRLTPAVTALKAPETGSLGFLLLALIYAVRIWADFTGGMDMALGVSRMLGIRLEENFRRPFLADSPGEFWRRWHITLGRFLRDYLFYPVSVSAPFRRFSRFCRRRLGRAGKVIPVHMASLITWLATGLWHGLTPNFLLWGLLNWVLVTLWQKPLKQRWLSICLTFLSTALIRLCDLWPDPSLFFLRLLPGPGALPPGLGLSRADILVLIPALLLCLRGQPRSKWAQLGLSIAVLILGVYGIGYEGASFIYDRF